MNEQELLFLGLLKAGPKHGYEIKRLLKDTLMPFISLDIKSIYYPLKKMEEKGLIAKYAGREGNFPEKHIYSLTPKGEKRFDSILNESFLTIKRPYFNIDLSLYFLPYAKPQIAKRRFRARVLFLRRIKRELAALKKNLKPEIKHLGVILEHNIDLVQAEIKSISRLIKAIL
ncbi:MAG: PadR family transcriptional regulator [Candidatus Omnitrophota bacterium]|nr:PadR family transcriptional regulator [Candidatus Omnitrophota bacterium]